MKTSSSIIYRALLGAMILFVPSLLMIFAKMSSFTPGIVLVSLVLICVKFSFSPHAFRIPAIEWRFTLYSFAIIFLLIVHFFLQSIFNDGVLPTQDFGKFLGSIVCILFLLIAAIVIQLDVKNLKESSFRSVVKILFSILVINAVISLSKIDFWGTGLPKPSFLYLEPSHFALIVAPFIFYYSVLLAGNVKKIILLGFFGVWALYIQNLTLLFALMVVYLISARTLLPAILLSAIVAGAGIIFINVDSMQYYLDRINLSSETDNISTLVLLQGWDNAVLTLQHTVLGVGFQQFGVSTLNGTFAERLYDLLGIYINVFDAGSTAPKLIGEFGVFGIILVVMYALGWLKVFINIRRKRIKNKKYLFFSCVYLSSFLDMFVRGTGYFTPTMFLLIVSIFYLFGSKTNNQETVYETHC